MPPLTKICPTCGKEFLKPYNCGKPEWAKRQFCSQPCKSTSQLGKPSGMSGKRFPSKAQKVPCRICKKPTRHNGTANSPLIGMIACKDPTCREVSKLLKNQRISRKATEMYANGDRSKIRHAWANVPRISPEEILLTPWLVSQGWISQHKVLTHVHTNTLPRMFRLDFALPEHKLYIEIDGNVHRLRKSVDARRDVILDTLGWKGLRIPAKTVRDDIQAIHEQILEWIRAYYVTT